MRDWLKSLQEIDKDCVRQWEKLLGIKLKSRTQYLRVDWLIDEMILEFESMKELRAAYPDIDMDVKRVLEGT